MVEETPSKKNSIFISIGSGTINMIFLMRILVALWIMMKIQLMKGLAKLKVIVGRKFCPTIIMISMKILYNIT